MRILGSLLAILLLFALTAALVKVELSPGLFFSVTMASVWFINSFCAVLQGSLFGQLGTMPSTYSTLFLSGQGLAGIFAALAMLMSLASECTWGSGGLSRESRHRRRVSGLWGGGRSDGKVEAEGKGPWAFP